ncbi:STAS domain-containing protein [Polaromonas sp. CG_23.6]|uniref:STAS domain-containing protein n=1 Tax=Polaromonas sp. CG_23.6 TaxID=2760709 RepID=UPI00247311CF|nr:STAS domain-containing protein [Polaromonas sp. CG_23.6]MDH6186289.1 ABC-type transporter Mla MlaB component [Polaromonas sp. CG_23.6]
MSKDDSASGLLSKLVKFVRNPATNWTELDSIDGGKDDAVTKQLLNEMIERKRRNDFVRKREFDMLRKLRKLEVSSGPAADPVGRPSFFQSSLTFNVDDRAVTLKKIDDIEAQMSKHWWTTKSQTADGSVNELAPVSFSPVKSRLSTVQGALPDTFQPTILAGADSVHPADEPVPAFLLDDLLGSLPESPIHMKFAVADKSTDSGVSGLLPSLASDLEHEPIVHDAELEESAILFANGDDAGAEAGLFEILRPGASHADNVYTWLTLFDLYRATGEQAKFEAAVLEFAEHFNRSAPQWFSLPEMVKALVQPGEKSGHESMDTDWICPSGLSLQSVGALNTAMARSSMPWCLDWRYLKTIETAALESLLKVFSDWAVQPVQLRFLGEAQLQTVLIDSTPSGERATDTRWWLLRMEMLRIIHRPDDFELTALDFCVTYEVSPPAWEVARCDYKSLDDEGDAMGQATIIGEPTTETNYSTLMELGGDSVLDFSPSKSIRFLSVDLSGQIQDDAVGVLDRLEASLTGADRMQISCAKLIRVDFSAAGMLLNWVSARRAENRFVEFSEVNRLVAAFFSVIGIVEYAKVSARND